MDPPATEIRDTLNNVANEVRAIRMMVDDVIYYMFVLIDRVGTKNRRMKRMLHSILLHQGQQDKYNTPPGSPPSPLDF